MSEAKKFRAGSEGIGARGGEERVDAAAGGEAVELSGRRAGLWADAWRELRHDPLFLVAGFVVLVFVAMAAFPGLFSSVDPRACDLSRSLAPPGGGHPFGYDLLGCDYYARVVHGARVSIAIGVLATGSTVVIAVVLGSLAGYFRGPVDTVISRLTDVVFGLPFILGAIVLLSVVGTRGVLEVGLVLVALGWTTMTRLMRSSVLSVVNADHVSAAKALGASDARILATHVLPNAVAPVMVYATIYVGIVIAVEATLSFLGVGLQLPAISWGLMISDAQYRISEAPHLLLFPGLFLSLTVLSFILMGDALRDALDPKLR
ncbi:peptide/nickel transport system permease protein/oligopeptide transport system permease protein [Asanoa hainanensis]|uniref:Peptide/nickel transport system permease protein/oligopeptide transport system permease protein n=1 Tax=Asanoa hainanensis TaxID=560556 RepID=A0A239PFX3_9ACTN|nr:ABC transporter permease [Asanoa hainanensis]SNT65538.1 peptide/nickel transport system permease protein/oligopeptide transport system permease protein [Asanoa hainanensis]